MRYVLHLVAAVTLAFASAHAGNLELRVAPKNISIRHGTQPKMEATLANRTDHDVTLMLPGDGSDVIFRTPVVGWSFLPHDSKANMPSKANSWNPRGYADMNPLRKSEVFTLHPGESKSFWDWLAWPIEKKPGNYRVVFYYTNDPKIPINGSLLGPNEPGVEALLSASTPCSLVSNEIVVEITE